MKKPSNELPVANRKYKDTIFRWLFSDRKNLLSLYNAVSGKNYQKPELLKVVTLENAVYMGMKNDLAFVLETGLYLYEHQSTYNPNLPLRDLFYIASEYQTLVDKKSLYSSSIQKIPTPSFLVFYNGEDKEVPERQELRLSDAYENPTREPELELKVTVLNINAGHNQKLMEDCHVLWEYAQYVARVRKYAAELPLDEAVERAITECIREGILTEFLEQNRAEVYQVSIFEYDKEEEEKKLRRAEYEYGKEEGRKEGKREGIEEGIKQGRKQGVVEGREEGIKQGRTEERIYILRLISQMNAGGDAEKISQLDNQEVLEAMKRKYEIQ